MKRTACTRSLTVLVNLGLLMSALLATAATARASEPETRSAGWAALQEFEGKDPWGCLEDSRVQSRLEELLGGKYDLFLESIQQAESPVLASGHLVIPGSAPGLATIMEAVVVLDLGAESVSVGLLDDERIHLYGGANSEEELPEPLRDWVADLRKRAGEELPLSFVATMSLTTRPSADQ